MEFGGSNNVYTNPLHPYNQALLLATPDTDTVTEKSEQIILKGEVPRPFHSLFVCMSRTRSPHVQLLENRK
ncbi:ABC transporter ATP-binding protein [Bacillus sp. FSL K6-3431]|uniref:ABC transporter ATP-binding protein n=1 Tax=Bacillus sp. FSL K6-3431 TaxID=2921500 RepID=UPI0030F82521